MTAIGQPFIGGFQLDSGTSLNNLNLNNHTTTYITDDFEDGVILTNATGVAVNDVDIGVDADAPSFDPHLTYRTGINMKNSSLSINHSNIYGYSNIGGSNNAGVGYTDAIGVYGVGSKVDITNITNSIIKAKSEHGNSYGLFTDTNTSIVTIGPISGSTFKGEAEGGGSDVTASGMDVTGNDNVTIGDITNGSHFFGSATNTEDQSNAYGLRALSSVTLQ
jgi:hypothetical protein